MNAEDPIAELSAPAKPDDKRGKKQADAAADAMRDVGELWHDENDEPWMTFTLNGHREHWPLRSKTIRSLISLTYYRKTGATLGSQARQDALARLEGLALFEGTQHPVYTRIAGVDGVIWIDLADEAWRAIRITQTGWCVMDNPPMFFRRRRGMRPLPEPIAGGTIEALRPFVNVASDDDWIMVVAYLVATLRPAGPYPVLEFTGEAGSAKSTVCREIRSLIDPSNSPLRAEPREVRDLMITSRNNWIVTLDNISHLAPWLSDALCRLATGGGFATRELYSDDEEVIFEAMRPVIINGIEALAERGDLAQRSIVIALSSIDDRQRRDEATFWAEFEQVRPSILGALLDAVSGALRRLPDTHLARMPRMSDFARWIVAAAPDLGFTPEAFLSAYERNRANANEVTLESSPIAAIIIDIADPGWAGTATDLLDLLRKAVDESSQKRRDFPASTKALRGSLARLTPHLRQIDINIDFQRTGSQRVRTIVIRKGGDSSVPTVPTVRADLTNADGSKPSVHTSETAVSSDLSALPASNGQMDGSDGLIPEASQTVPVAPENL